MRMQRAVQKLNGSIDTFPSLGKKKVCAPYGDPFSDYMACLLSAAAVEGGSLFVMMQQKQLKETDDLTDKKDAREAGGG
jgi:hypothetical protein